MKFVVEIDVENEAFEGQGLGRELSRILQALGRQLAGRDG